MPTQDHILVVDDDAEIRALLREYLQKQGYRVTALADGRALRSAVETCCRIELDRRGGVAAYEPRDCDSCGCD